MLVALKCYHERLVYWTWCSERGKDVPRPDADDLGAKTAYVCADCR